MKVSRAQSGVVLMNKPVGATSFEVMQAVAEGLKTIPGRRWKVCHGGALDPFACGLLPILVGPATKLFERLHELPKTYEATVAWGRETDTGDAAGQTVSTGDPTPLTPPQLADALSPFLGWHNQVPPPTSNKRVRGERAYVLAHRGESFELPASRVYLHEAEWTRHALPQSSELRLTCRGGYYVRALVRDIGRTLGTFAHLTALRRTAVGPFEVPLAGPAQRTGLQVVPWFETVEVDDDTWGRLKAGQRTDAFLIDSTPRQPQWPWPPLFPRPERRMVAGIHRGRVAALMEHVADTTFRLETCFWPPLS
jgi:tRNA pseudouridine55 synthase